MAKFVTLNPVIVVGGSTVTASCASVTISIEADDVETTSFGSSDGWRTRIGGLKSGTVDFEFHQDFGAGGIDNLLYPLLGGTTSVSVRPGGSAAVGSANPQFTFDVLVQQLNLIDSAVGDLATTSVSFPITGPVTRATA